MKIYLQDCKNLTFIRCDSLWSSDISEALDFISVRRATLYGLRELKDAFQLLQVEADGFQSRVSDVIPQLPAVKMGTVPRPVRAGHATSGISEILRRIWQPTSQRVPVMLPHPVVGFYLE
jgi:hypothetical protein